MNLRKLSKKLLPCLFVSVILSGAVVSTLFAIEPKEILRRSLEAQFGLNFEGIQKAEFRLPGKNYTITTRVIRQKPDFSYTATLTPSRIRRLVTLDDGKFRMWHIRGSNKSEFFPSLNSPEAKEIKRKSLNLKFKNYKISQLIDSYVGGRSVYVISLIPRHAGNPWQKVWIDKETYLPLKEEKYNWKGELFFAFHYTGINFDPRFSKEKLYQEFPQRLIKRSFFSRERFLSLKDLKAKIRFPVSIPHYLPPGYEFQEAVLLFKGKAVKITYTNGVGVICLSQTPSPRGYPETWFEDFEGAHPLVWRKRGKTFVLIADISRKELIKIAQSVK